MRDECVLAATARELKAAGLHWQPQVGDWVMLLDGAYLTASQAGLYLVIEIAFDGGWVMVRDAEGKWPPTRIVSKDALWLPTIGQLKTWLRGNQYRVQTLEYPFESQFKAPAPQRTGWGAHLLPQHTTQPIQSVPALRFRCYAFTHDAREEYTHDALNEVESVAGIILTILTKRLQHSQPS